MEVDNIGYSEELSKKAADLVEQERDQGRPGAFVIRRIIDDVGTDNVEVWGLAD